MNKTDRKLYIGFEIEDHVGDALRALWRHLPAQPPAWADGITPDISCEIDNRDTKVPIDDFPDLIDANLDREVHYGRTYDEPPPESRWWDYFFSYKRPLLKQGIKPYHPPHTAILDLLRDVNFRLAACSPLWDAWYDHPDRRRFGLSDGHYGHGFFCAFRGQAGGHDRLVTRRWLDYGPWRLIRYDDLDISVVEFHDYEADWETALHQAVPGHETMGISEVGGFIPTRITYQAFEPSFFDKTTNTSIVLVQGREPTPREMIEAAAVKRWQPFDDIHVQQVAFVYFDEDLARRQLHDLWLRGLECRVMRAGREVCLTDDYQPPPPVVPDWVKRVQDREGF